MATTSTWGNAHFGDEAEYRRKLAFALALKRADQPILHPLQGINNVAREWMAALEDKQREDKLAGEQKSLTDDFVTANGIGSPPTVRQPQPASTAQPGSAAPTSPPNSFQGKPVIELPTKRVSPLSGAENVPPNLADALSAPSFDTAGAEGAPDAAAALIKNKPNFPADTSSILAEGKPNIPFDTSSISAEGKPNIVSGPGALPPRAVALADAIDKKREPDAAVGLPPSQDAFSPQNAFSPPAKTTASQYGADTGPLHGKVSPQAVAASVAAMAQRRGWDGPNSSFTPEAVSGLMKQESAYRNAPPNPHRYAGYFQMRPGEFTPAGEYILNTKTYKGPTMTPADFAKMSYQEHQELYGNRLQALGYTGTQNLGVMNAAPAYKDRPDDFVAYRAGSREAMANPAWRNASGAGGAVTVGGIKNWHQAGSPQIAPSRQMAAAPWQRDPEALGGGGAPNNAAAFAPPDAQPPAQETIQPYRVAGNGNVAPPRFAQNNPPGGNMFSPTPTPGASFQSFERPPQANAVRSPAQAAAEEAAKAQRQMQIYGAGFQRTTNLAHQKIYFDAYKAAEEAYKAATTSTQELKEMGGLYYIVTTPPGGKPTYEKATPDDVKRLVEKNAMSEKTRTYNDYEDKRESLGYPKGSMQDFNLRQQMGIETDKPIYADRKGQVYPPPVAGEQYTRDEDGFVTGRVKATPGSEHERKLAEQDKKRTEGERAEKNYNDVVLRDADRAISLAEKHWTTGPGSYLAVVRGSKSHDLSKVIDSIKAGVGFDRLQIMRYNATGGALGNVSEKENLLLQAALGSLEQSQSKEQFVSNMKNVKRIYADIIRGPGRTSVGGEGAAPGVAASPNPREDAWRQKYGK